MSENKSGAGGADDQAGGNDQEKKTVAYESHKKLLDEKKKRDAELSEVRGKLELYEQEKLEAEGKVKELNENLKKALGTAKQEKAELAKTVTNKVLFQQFAREAEKLGCLNVKMAYSAVDLSDIDVSQDLELDEVKLKEKLSVFAKENGFLFQNGYKKPNDLNPKVVDGKGSVDLSEMKIDDLKKLLKNAK